MIRNNLDIFYEQRIKPYGQTYDDFLKAVDWIKTNFRPIKSINCYASSYALKHVMQRENGVYMDQKQFIELVILLGFKEKDGKFNISQKSPAMKQRKK